MRIDRLAYELLYGLFIVTLIYMIIGGLLVPVAAGTAGGTEFNLVSVWMPTTMYGGVGVFAAPFNVSQPGLVTVNNFYVVDQQGHPYYSYLFSTNPPLAVWADGSIASKTYTLFYGGGNPYSDYIATPGGSVPLFPAYDDFDYDSGLWIYTGSHAILNSLDYLNGEMMLNKSYTPGVFCLWLIRFGKTGSMIQLYSTGTYKGWVLLRLTGTNFGAWNNIIDGNDIYFLDKNGNPLYYDILYFNKTLERADILVDVELDPGINTIYMLYGQQNPYTQYRVEPAYPTTVIDITPPAGTPGTKTQIQLDTTQTYTALNTTATIEPGTIIAPHLYNAYFYNTSSSTIDFGGNTLDFSTLGVVAGIKAYNVTGNYGNAIFGKGYVGLGANSFSLWYNTKLAGETNTYNGTTNFVVTAIYEPFYTNQYYNIFFTYNGSLETVGIVNIGNASITQSYDI
ncbi:MAG: DUF2341 domain-containing protein, partial [Crenarchaeota archaeon]|nr:DUF2341 domain-containing protein [Thermoproteota archaeon]